MTRPMTSDQADAHLRKLVALVLGAVVLTLAPLSFYALHLEQRLDTLRYHDPTELETVESEDSAALQDVSPSYGQTLYVPAYSHVYHGAGDHLADHLVSPLER